jgi:competence ComEA-like helix-hairpin-helix protein
MKSTFPFGGTGREESSACFENGKHPTPNIQHRTSIGLRFGKSLDVGCWMLNVRCSSGHQASILVGLLWCVALLSLVVVGTLHTSRIDLMAVKNYGDRIQAHYLALAGIEKAKALLYQNAHDRSRSAKNHSGDLYNAPDQFRDVSFSRGKFRVFRRGRQDEGGGVIYGITDEESRLNVNYASAEQLTNLTQMTTDIASAILDWRGGGGGGSTVNPGGANADYYLSLQPPYQPRHGPVQTVRELLLVRGVTRDLLFGKDKHQNGMLPAAGDGEDDTLSADTLSDDTDLGWAGILTVASTENNFNAGGQDRVNVQTADENALTGVKGITSQMARAIVSYRGQNQLQSIADLLDVTASQNQNSGSNPNSGQRNSNQGQPSSQNSSGSTDSSSGGSGSKVISQDVFLQLADDVTTADGQTLAGMININTAGLDVLMCLPGVDRQLAQAIINYRQSSGYFANTGELLKVGGMTQTLFKQIAPLVSARSETFRILCEGKVTSTGARQRIQEIVHVGLNEISTLGYREDDL